MSEINKLIKNKSGDTIVEVLMSIAIVGAVITGAYALASRSLAEGVSASEHSQAIKLAESQVESLKSRNKDALNHISDIWDNYFDLRVSSAPADKDNFCLDTQATSMLDAANSVKADWKPQYNNGPGFTGNNLKTGNSSKPNTYNPVCTNDRSGVASKYFINVKLTTYTNKSPTYLVTVQWVPEGNHPASQAQLYYRF